MGEIDNWTYDEISFVHVYLFRVIGILPYSYDAEQSNFRIFLRNYLPRIYWHILNLIYNTMYVGYGIRMALQGGLDVEYICEEVITQGVSIRFLILCLQRNKLLSLINVCGDMWLLLRAGEEKTVRNFERMAYYLRNIFLCNGTIAAIFFITTTMFIKIPPANVNDTAKKILPIKFYVDVQDDFWYNAVYALQTVVLCSIAVILTGIETVGPFLIMMACGYLRVLQYRFLALTNLPNDSGSIKESATNMGKLPVHEILCCVKFHQKIMEFCHQIEQFTRYLFLIQVLCTVYNMSLIGIKLLEHDQNELKYISILVLNLLQFFTCQWFPEYLLNESDAISNAAYNAALTHPIYEHEANRMLFLTILRAEKPVQLTAGGYIKLSLETFERMVVSAMSFFTVLRSFST